VVVGAALCEHSRHTARSGPWLETDERTTSDSESEEKPIVEKTMRRKPW